MLRPASLASDIRVIAPDVVHTHSGLWYKGGLAARMAGVPLQVHTDHGRRNPEPWSDKLIDRLASRRTDAVVAVSEVLGRQLRHIVTRPSSVCVIPNGVNIDEYAFAPDDGAVRRELGIATAAPIIGSIGRLEPVKGYDIMVAAFARLRNEWRDSTPPVLVLVGDGSDRPALEQIATESGCRDAVYFLGWRTDLHALHQSFTLFTMSSRSEGTSISLLESMSAGLCPVVTRVGGNPAVLGDALAHRLVDPESPEALVTAWTNALRENEKRTRDAMAARQRVEDDFSLDTTVRAYEALYAGVPTR
jgi:glycosyltransferase involved in cell wall biosynthesis